MNDQIKTQQTPDIKDAPDQVAVIRDDEVTLVPADRPLEDTDIVLAVLQEDVAGAEDKEVDVH